MEFPKRLLEAGEVQNRGEIEVCLAKKLSSEKITDKVYQGTHADEARKILMDAMPDNVRQAIVAGMAKAADAIIAKAKELGKDTFEFNGFYLGMSIEDVKILLAKHFPDFQFVEGTDGDARILDVSYQNPPLCYADREGKVYQFNFGKKMLKKWYKYDVQNYMEWAAAYSQENKINMQYKLIEKDTEVYDGDQTHTVWFYQNSYQYKHNTKEYRLIYFGEPKDMTIQGGLGGAIIKSMAERSFRYTRGDPGMLRATIERD